MYFTRIVFGPCAHRRGRLLALTAASHLLLGSPRSHRTDIPNFAKKRKEKEQKAAWLAGKVPKSRSMVLSLRLVGGSSVVHSWLVVGSLYPSAAAVTRDTAPKTCTTSCVYTVLYMRL